MSEFVNTEELFLHQEEYEPNYTLNSSHRVNSTSTINSEYSIIQNDSDSEDVFICVNETVKVEMDSAEKQPMEAQKEEEALLGFVNYNEKSNDFVQTSGGEYERRAIEYTQKKEEVAQPVPRTLESALEHVAVDTQLERILILENEEATAVAEMMEKSKNSWSNINTKMTISAQLHSEQPLTYDLLKTIEETVTSLFLQLERNQAQLNYFNENFNANNLRLQDCLVQKRYLTKQLGAQEIIVKQMARENIDSIKESNQLKNRVRILEEYSKELADMFLSNCKESISYKKMEEENNSVEGQLWMAETRVDWAERKINDLERRLEKVEEANRKREKQEQIKKAKVRFEQRKVDLFATQQPAKPFGRLPVDYRLEPLLNEVEKAFLNNQFFHYDPQEGEWGRYRELAKRYSGISRLGILLGETSGALVRTKNSDKLRMEQLDAKRQALREVLRRRKQPQY